MLRPMANNRRVELTAQPKMSVGAKRIKKLVDEDFPGSKEALVMDSAEIQFGVLSTQCRGRRIPCRKAATKAVGAR